MQDQDELINDLNLLPAQHRVAFAASCCERLLPNYSAFSRMEKWGDPELLRRALDLVWSALQGSSISEVTIRGLIRDCERAAPDTEDFSSLFASAAGDAVSALCYTLKSYLDGDISHVSVVARLPFETLYQYLGRVNDPEVEAHIADPDFEEQMLGFPLMIAERKKQQQDLRMLRSHPKLTPELLQELRHSSTRSGLRPAERGLLPPDSLSGARRE